MGILGGGIFFIDSAAAISIIRFGTVTIGTIGFWVRPTRDGARRPVELQAVPAAAVGFCLHSCGWCLPAGGSARLGLVSTGLFKVR